MTMQAHILRAAAVANIARGFPSYAAFLAYITALTPRVYRGSSEPASSGGGLLRVRSLTASGNMWGSSWNASITTDSAYNRAIQHGVSSEAVFNGIVSGGFQVLLDVSITGSATFPSISRNGYTSGSYGSYPRAQLLRCVYWDAVAGEAMETQPYIGAGPAPYLGEP